MNNGKTNYWDILVDIASETGHTITDICRAENISTSYIAVNKARNSTPLLSNAIRFLNVCDYTLCAIPNDAIPNDAIVITCVDDD